MADGYGDDGNVIPFFPSNSNDRDAPRWETQNDFIIAMLQAILDETDTPDAIIIYRNEDGNLEPVSSDTPMKTVDMLDEVASTIEQQFTD